jgi:hypothetical protein
MYLDAQVGDLGHQHVDTLHDRGVSSRRIVLVAEEVRFRDDLVATLAASRRVVSSNHCDYLAGELLMASSALVPLRPRCAGSQAGDTCRCCSGKYHDGILGSLAPPAGAWLLPTLRRACSRRRRCPCASRAECRLHHGGHEVNVAFARGAGRRLPPVSLLPEQPRPTRPGGGWTGRRSGRRQSRR